ncbi:MAG: M56 family metallopeptidase [Bacteroidota bacterium]
MWALAEIAFKSTFLLALGGLVAWGLGRFSASYRHGVWMATFVALLLLPAVTVLGPAWQIQVLPASWGGAVERQPAPALSEAVPAVQPRFAGRLDTSEQTVAPLPGSMQPAWTDWGWTQWIVGVWLAGFVFVGGRQLWALVLAYRVVRAAEPLETEPWIALAASVASRSGLQRPIDLLRSETMRVPFAWGLGRPAVVVPSRVDGWDAARLEAVLLHEMAHLRRRDAWTQLIMQAVVACYWMHPLAWLAYRRCMDARESACDDAVLRSGASPADYATHLVAVAREVRASHVFPAAVPMMGGDELGTRVESILDGARQREPANQWLLVTSIGIACAIGAVLALLQPAAAVAERGPSGPGLAPLPIEQVHPDSPKTVHQPSAERLPVDPVNMETVDPEVDSGECEETAFAQASVLPSDPKVDSTSTDSPVHKALRDLSVLAGSEEKSATSVGIVLPDTVSARATRLTSDRVARLLELPEQDGARRIVVPLVDWYFPVPVPNAMGS